MSLALLILVGLLLAIWVWRDFKDYPRFKAFTETRDRQRTFARWLIQSFALFTLGSIVCLALIGALSALTAYPAALHVPPSFRVTASSDLLGGLGAGMLIGFIALTVIAARSAGRTAPVAIGDIMALMPRNRAEYGYVTLLSINAGVGEELFFRLLLPLLLVTVTHDAVIAFAVSVVVFGLAHLYQGWAGVLVTGLAGIVMTAIYIGTGSILWPILVHVLIDLRGLVLQPALTAWFRSQQK